MISTKFWAFPGMLRSRRSRRHIDSFLDNGILVCTLIFPGDTSLIDQNPDNKDEATEKFYDISDAYETLIDSEKRAKYDLGGEDAVNGNNGGGGGGGFQRGNPYEQFQTFFQFFGQDGGGGGHRQFHQPVQNLYDANSGVTEIGNTNEWNTHVGQRSDVVVVDFYSPTCQPCIALKDQYIAVAKTFTGIVRILAVNCQSAGGKQLCQSQKVQGYPSIRMYSDDNKVVDFPANQDKTSKNIGNWISNSMPDVTTKIDSEKKLKDLVAGAAGKAVVLLFSDKAQTPALYKSLCRSFRTNIACGIVLNYSVAAPPAFLKGSQLDAKVTKTPSLYYVHDAVSFDGEFFKGSMTSEILSLFFSRVVSHNSRQVRVDQLTPSRKDDCSPTDSATCVLLLTDPNSSNTANSTYAVFKQLADKYKSDPVKFFWINSKSKFVSLFDKAGPPRVVAYRGKRGRYSSYDGMVEFDGMNNWVDNIVTGGTSLGNAVSRKPKHDEL